MRVVHIIKVTRISGAERHLLILLKGLREKGIDAHLIMLAEASNPMQEMIQAAQERDIPIQSVLIRRDYDLSVINRLRKIFLDLKPDLVHTHLIHADLFGLIAAKLARVPYVISSRHNDDMFRYHPLMRFVHRLLWWMSDGGIAISRAIRDFTVSVEGADYDKVHVVLYGMEYRWIEDEEIFSARQAIREELGLAQDTILLGIVCRLVEQKGIGYALEAFARIRRYFPDVHLIVAGDGSLSSDLRKSAQTLGITDSVHWLGWRDDAPRVMASLDIFLMPSLWEGFGLVMLEAMSNRVPIIASRVSAIPEVLKHGQSGWLVNPRDVDDLAQGLYYLLMDVPFRHYIGLLGEDRLEQSFSATKMVNKTLEVYRTILDSPPLV